MSSSFHCALPFLYFVSSLFLHLLDIVAATNYSFRYAKCSIILLRRKAIFEGRYTKAESGEDKGLVPPTVVWLCGKILLISSVGEVETSYRVRQASILAYYAPCRAPRATTGKIMVSGGISDLPAYQGEYETAQCGTSASASKLICLQAQKALKALHFGKSNVTPKDLTPAVLGKSNSGRQIRFLPGLSCPL